MSGGPPEANQVSAFSFYVFSLTPETFELLSPALCPMLYAPIHGNLPELKTFRKQKIYHETIRGTKR